MIERFTSLIGHVIKPRRPDGTTPGKFRVEMVDDLWLHGHFIGRDETSLLNAEAFESIEVDE